MQANSYDNPGNTGGNLESVMSQLSILEPEGTPFVSSIRKTSADATFTEAVADTLRAPRITGTREGKTAQGGNNKAKNRARFGNYCHRVFDEWGVTDVQQAVTRRGGNAVVDDEYGSAKAKTLRELKRDLESIALSNQEMQGGSDDEMQTRGFFKWVQTAAQATQPVPSNFRPASAQILSGIGTTVPLFTETEFNAVLKAVKQVYGEKKSFDCYAGDDVIETVDLFSRIVEDVDNHTVVRSVDEPGGPHTISFYVTVYESSFARVNMINDQFVRFSTTTSAGETNAAALCNPDLWELQWLEELTSKDEGDHGGGDAGWIRGLVASMCTNPKGNGAIYNT